MLLKGRYLIEKELGRGGIGLVYLARDQQLYSRPIVIKVLLDETDNQEDRAWYRKKFLQEIEALSRIDHPSIVGILDTGEMPDGKPFFAMQFIAGETLREMMKSGAQETGRVAQIVRQIGRALNVAHDQGVIHRDLKPENILLQRSSDGEETIKLIDFGIATVRDSQVATVRERTQAAGTILYMAPEQLLGRPAPQSDIYALGVIAYELLTGRRPYTPESPYQLLDLQRAGVRVKPRELRPEIPLSAEEAILRALTFHEGARYQQARDFGEALFQALKSGAGANASPAPPREGGDLVKRMLALSGRIAGAWRLDLWVEAEGARPVRDFIFVPDSSQSMPRFRLGERVAICARTERDCYLWIVAVGTSGRGAIIFPQGATNAVARGQTIRVPGTLGGPPGVETIHAFATISPRWRGLSLADPEGVLSVEERAFDSKIAADCATLTMQFAVDD